MSEDEDALPHHEYMDRYLRKHYGEQFVADVNQRVALIRNAIQAVKRSG